MIKPSAYEIRITARARKDIDKLDSKLKKKLKEILLEVISENPRQGKKLLSDLLGSYSYRLTYKDRIVYSIDETKRIVYIERTRTHYGD